MLVTAATDTTPRAAGGDGVVVDAATAALLHGARTVTVITNSLSVPDDVLDTFPGGEDTIWIVFNRHRYRIDDRIAARTIWVHRRDDVTGRFFGEPPGGVEPAVRCHRVRVAADDPDEQEIPAGCSYISSRAALPALRDYPVGRRLLIPRRRIRRIVSPSTGFVVFALLDDLQRNGAAFRIRAVGIGRQYDGWPGHDWAFERRWLRRSGIDFRTADDAEDRWASPLDRVPCELVRAGRRLATWRIPRFVRWFVSAPVSGEGSAASLRFGGAEPITWRWSRPSRSRPRGPQPLPCPSCSPVPPGSR